MRSKTETMNIHRSGCRPGLFGTLTAIAAAAISLAAAGTQASSGTTFESAGVPIRYEVIGQGPPVVFLHGFGASFDRTRLPAALLDALSGYQLVGMDVRGFGQSGKPDDPSAYGLEVARDVIRLMDHLDLRKAHLLGFSMGGIIALKTAAMYPDRVSSLILGAQGWPSREDLDEMSTAGAMVAASATGDLPADLRDAVEHTGRHVFTGFVQAYPALYVTPDELDRLRMPILAILGSEDERVSRAQALRARHPRTQLVIVPGQDHGGVLGDAAFGEAVKRFLDGHR